MTSRRCSAPFVAYLWIGILTFTTYTLAGHMREQVCLYMCPWPRIQAALTDEHALNVTYRYDRGEPRGSVKKSGGAARSRACRPATASTACNASHVCPTGVDIRDGPNLGCIQCGLCIDACDAVMAQDRPADAADRLRHRRQHQAPAGGHSAGIPLRAHAHRALRRRSSRLVGGVMTFALVDAHRAVDQRPPRPQSDVRAAVRRRASATPTRCASSTSAPSGASSRSASPGSPARCSTCVQTRDDGRVVVEVGPDQTREVRVLVTDYADLPPRLARRSTSTSTTSTTGERAAAGDYFRAPAGG